METFPILLAAALLAALLGLLALLMAQKRAARRIEALTAERDAARTKCLLAEGALGAMEQRIAEFARLREESVEAAKAAALATAQALSSKLLDDHKREATAQREEAETRVREASLGLTKQVEEIAKAVAALHGQLQEKGKTLDTLWRALSSPGGAGQLAEIGLANTLRGFGLESGRDFLLQVTTADEESGRRLRPDAVVFLPGNSALVIDCKASKFLVDIATEEAGAYEGLARTMNQHLKSLVEKDYRNAILTTWRQSGRGDEITRVLSVMYLPNEAALEKLYRADPDFFHKARAAQIIPAGPAGLHCALSLAAAEINLMRQIENQEHITEASARLLESLSVALSHAGSIGKGLKAAAEGFTKLVTSINHRLLPRARTLTKLGITPGKPLPGNLTSYSVQAIEPDLLVEGEASEIEEVDSAGLQRLARGEGGA